MSNNDKPKQVASAGSGASSNTGVRTLSDTTSISGNELIRVVVTAQTVDSNTGNTVTSSSTYSGQSTGTAGTSFSPTGTTSNIITERPAGSYQPPAPTQGNASLIPLRHPQTLEPSSDYNYAGPTSIGDDFSDDEEIEAADVFASSREAGTNEKNITAKNNDKWVASGLGQFVDVNFGALANIKAVQIAGKGVAEIHDANNQPVATVNLSGNHTYEFKEPLKTSRLMLVNQTPGRLEVSHVRPIGSVEERPDQKESKKQGSVVPSNDTAIASEADTSDAAASDTIDTNSTNTGEDVTGQDVSGADEGESEDVYNIDNNEGDSSSADDSGEMGSKVEIEKSTTDSTTKRTRKR